MRTDLIWLGVCGALAAGVAVGFANPWASAVWQPLVGLVLLVALFGYGFRVRGWLYVVVFGVGLILAGRTTDCQTRRMTQLVQQTQAHPVVVAGYLHEVTARSVSREGVAWYAGVVDADGLPLRVMFPCAATAPAPCAGERWEFAGWLSAPAAQAPLKLWVKGTQTRAVRLPDTWRTRLARLRRSLRTDLARRAGLGLEHDPLAAALNRAILLGARAALDPSVKSDFVNAGTIHIFSISGLHVMFVAQVLLVVFLLCAVPIRWMGLVLIPALWLYTWIIGCPPSAVRATLMASLYYCAPFVGRRSHLMTAWALTFMLVHVWDPARLFDVGNLLSFTVMLGIAIWLTWGPRWTSPLWNGLGVTVVAWAAGVPIAACTFARLTAGGLVANFLLIPISEVSVIFGVLGCFVSFVSETLAVYFNNISGLATRLMSVISSCVADVPGSSVEIAPWSWLMCALWYVALGLCIGWVRMLAKKDKFLYAIRKTPQEGDPKQ